jgi:FkbM family methyltransferase
MAANSTLRRLVKRVLFPLLPERGYSYLQGLAMAHDIRRGSFSEPELDLIPFAVRRGDTVLDIGANFGLYTYHLSRAVGDSGRVFAFEPVPFTNRTLRLVARWLGVRNAEIVPKGCGDRPGRVAFNVPVMSYGGISAGLAHIGQRNDDRPGKETQVRWPDTRQIWCELVSLDDYLPEISEISLIKCDVEGAELMALRGAERILDRHSPTIICEINPWYLEGFGVALGELTGFLRGKGYGIYRYEGRRLGRIVSESDIVEDNYIFLHGSRIDRFQSLLPQPDPAQPAVR